MERYFVDVLKRGLLVGATIVWEHTYGSVMTAIGPHPVLDLTPLIVFYRDATTNIVGVLAVTMTGLDPFGVKVFDPL